MFPSHRTFLLGLLVCRIQLYSTLKELMRGDMNYIHTQKPVLIFLVPGVLWRSERQVNEKSPLSVEAGLDTHKSCSKRFSCTRHFHMGVLLRAIYCSYISC